MIQQFRTKQELIDRIVLLDQRRTRMVNNNRPAREINEVSREHARLRKRLLRIERTKGIKLRKEMSMHYIGVAVLPGGAIGEVMVL